jgi:hypothetical protein
VKADKHEEEEPEDKQGRGRGDGPDEQGDGHQQVVPDDQGDVMTAPVSSHNQEYSSRSFLLLTSSTTTAMIRMLATTAKIF